MKNIHILLTQPYLIDFFNKFSSKSVFHPHFNLRLRILGCGSEEVPGLCRGYPVILYAFLVRADGMGFGIIAGEAGHFAHTLAILVPFHLPLFVPIPHVSHNVLRILFATACGIDAQLILFGQSEPLVEPS